MLYIVFRVQGGDKLTLALGSAASPKSEVVTSQLIEVDSSPTLTTTTVTSQPSNIDLLSSIATLATPLSPSKVSLPISVTHFSENGMAGLQRETLFSDNFLNSGVSTSPTTTATTDTASKGTNSTNPFVGNFVPPPTIPTIPTIPSIPSIPTAPITSTTQSQSDTENQTQKFATIGRSNPFTSPNKSKNPFLDRLDAPVAPTIPPSQPATSPSPMSTGSLSNSPEASLDPTSETDSSSSTLNKIVSRALF